MMQQYQSFLFFLALARENDPKNDLKSQLSLIFEEEITFFSSRGPLTLITLKAFLFLGFHLSSLSSWVVRVVTRELVIDYLTASALTIG